MYRSIALFVTTFLLAEALVFEPPVTTNPAAAFKTATSKQVTTTIAPKSTAITPNATTITPNATTITPNTTTVAPNTTSIGPNTTALAPNATTIAPNTTAIAPNATTLAPNATTLAPNATTLAPNATTLAPNTTTPITTTMLPTPTPTVTPTQGDYHIGDGNGTCIRIKAVIEISVNNSDAVGVFIVQPNETTPAGNCNDAAAHVELKFNEGFIQMTFIKKDSPNTVYVNSIGAKLEYAFKSGSRYTFTVSNTSVQLFSMGAGHSYSCSSDNIFMGNGIQLKFSQLRLQALDFHSTDFGQPDICKNDQPNYRVAIAVGVVLIILIIIVVVVYLISRKRRTDGYQSL